MENTVYKKKNRIAAMLCCLLMAAVSVVSATSITAYAWSFHGIDMTDVDNVELYFMDISVNELWTHHWNRATTPFHGVGLAGRGNVSMMMCFEFPKFVDTTGSTKDTDTFFILKQVILNCPDPAGFFPIIHTWGGYHFVDEKGNAVKKLTISLSNNYYKYLIRSPGATKQADGSYTGMDYLKDFYIKVQYYDSVEKKDIVHQFDGAEKGQRGGLFNNTISLYSVDSNPDILNPDSDDFDLNAGNTGDQFKPDSNNNVDDNDGFDFFQWLVDLFKMPVEALYTIIAIIGAILAFVIVLKFIRWAKA